MVLRFQSATKTLLRMHQCLGCCWSVLAQCQGFLCFWLCRPNK